MKKSIFIILMLFFGTVFSISANAKEDISIVCTNSAIADFASNLITKNVTIEYVIDSGACPAYYTLKPSQVELITNADVIISLGNQNMEFWLADLLSYNDHYSLIECKDMGEWNIPTGAISYVEHISNGLKNIFPELNESIENKTNVYINNITKKADELKDIIISSNYTDKKVIAMGWQKDFLEYFGLNVVYTYGPPQGLSAKDQLDIINAAMDSDISVIIDNLQSGTDFGARVASETGKIHVIFSNFPEAIPGTDTYLEMIDYNIDQLTKGIDTYQKMIGYNINQKIEDNETFSSSFTEISGLKKQVTDLELERNLFATISVIFLVLAILFYIIYKKK